MAKLSISIKELCGLFGLLVLLASVASARNLFSTKNETAVPPVFDETEPTWYEDLLNMPSSVPFPGYKWLDRVAKSESVTPFSWKGETYSSVYAAFLENKPLDYPCRNFNAYVNSVFMSTKFAEKLVAWTGSLEFAHYILCYLRNFIGACFLYYAVAGTFHYFCYVHPISYKIFEDMGRTRPSSEVIWDQIKVAQSSLTIYVLFPVVDEYVVDKGWTYTYFTIKEIGGFGWYMATMVLYFTLVEIGVYWMHRKLHTNKWLYRNIHLKHHSYKAAETLTPWASLAFHPVDGLMQACPYVLATFLVPCHYSTQVALMFFTEIWATYIHDAMDWNIDPIMGSKYHTVHHTHYIYNYGQVFTFCDRFWGTLRIPTEPTGSAKQHLKKLD